MRGEKEKLHSCLSCQYAKIVPQDPIQVERTRINLSETLFCSFVLVCQRGVQNDIIRHGNYMTKCPTMDEFESKMVDWNERFGKKYDAAKRARQRAMNPAMNRR